MSDGTGASDVFDALRGAVIDLPVGNILPNWVTKAAVIEAIDRIEEERADDWDRSCETCRDGGHVIPKPHRVIDGNA